MDDSTTPFIYTFVISADSAFARAFARCLAHERRRLSHVPDSAIGKHRRVRHVATRSIVVTFDNVRGDRA